MIPEGSRERDREGWESATPRLKVSCDCSRYERLVIDGEHLSRPSPPERDIAGMQLGKPSRTIEFDRELRF